MSTIKVTNIQDTGGGNNSTSSEIYSGRAKAWVNFNGSGTVAIRADYNVNTVGDLGTGQYQVNFSTAFSDTNYCATMTGRPTADYLYNAMQHFNQNRTTSYLQCTAGSPTFAADADTFWVCVHR